uniref:Uncharacterized protein n=1 Tax=Salix viminalis TaxID=40686 RepID=A0A6N2M8Z5_SALVM
MANHSTLLLCFHFLVRNLCFQEWPAPVWPGETCFLLHKNVSSTHLLHFPLLHHHLLLNISSRHAGFLYNQLFQFPRSSKSMKITSKTRKLWSDSLNLTILRMPTSPKWSKSVLLSSVAKLRTIWSPNLTSSLKMVLKANFCPNF